MGVAVTLGLGSLIGGLASGAANLWSSWFNTNRSDYLTEEQWRRDDTAIQRRVADLKAAGLSPVLAAGQGAQTSAPVSSNTMNSSFANPVIEALSAIQMKSQIDSTNAGTALTEFQQQTEKWKQDLMQQQVNKTISETLNLDKQNNIFDLDVMSKINLRNKQANNLLQNAELLKANTIYRQTELDQLKTQIDTAKILRDIQNFNRATMGMDKQLHYYDTYTKHTLSRYLPFVGDIQSLLPVKTLGDYLNNLDNSWYWENN